MPGLYTCSLFLFFFYCISKRARGFFFNQLETETSFNSMRKYNKEGQNLSTNEQRLYKHILQRKKMKLVFCFLDQRLFLIESMIFNHDFEHNQTCNS